MNNDIANYGSDAVASCGIANKIDMVPIMLSVGLSQGVAPLIGYCYGAGQSRRMAGTMRLSMLYGCLLGGLFVVCFLTLASSWPPCFFVSRRGSNRWRIL